MTTDTDPTREWVLVPREPTPEMASAMRARGVLYAADFWRDVLQAAPQAAPQAEPVAPWRPIESAPLDGTLVRLLVRFDNHGIEDTNEPTWTIGSHNDGEWNFVGWDWHTDEWTRGSGDLLGWLQIGPAAAPQAEPVAWMESPHGAIRANPAYRWTAPQTVAWSIPLYAAAPQGESK